MAEQIMLNDLPYLPAQETSSNEESMHPLERLTPDSRKSLRLSQDTVPLDDIRINKDLQIATKMEAKDLHITNANEESNVESPTTGEDFVHKCVFCERVLTASDFPKLLECLHNCCGSCINNKLYEQNESNVNKGTAILL